MKLYHVSFHLNEINWKPVTRKTKFIPVYQISKKENLKFLDKNENKKYYNLKCMGKSKTKIREICTAINDQKKHQISIQRT